jgi:hypothetical protein
VGGDQTDFTGDGTDDILLFNNSTREIGYWQMQDGQIPHYQQITGLDWVTSTPGWWYAPTKYGGDFNGDGRDDILLSSQITNDTAIALATSTSTAIAVGLDKIGSIEETGDFTGDGSTDIIANNNGHLYLYDMLNGAVSDTRYLGNHPGWDIVGGSAGDFTGDGVEDVVWRHNSTGEVGYWDFNGDGASTTWVSLGTFPDYMITV